MKPELEAAYNKLNTTVDEDGRIYKIDAQDDNKVSFLYNSESTILGHIMIGENNLLYHRFDDEKNIFTNIFVKTDSWGVDYAIFKVVDLIVYETLTHLYKIPKVRALEFGAINKYDKETKIYIPIKYWDKRHKGVDKVEERRRNLLGDSWYEVLKPVINSEYMSTLGNYLRGRRKVAKVYPDEEDIFRAFKLTSFEQTKVVIIGQDPYNDGSASGVAFAFKGVPNYQGAKSLHVIYNEVERDIYSGFNLDTDFTLEPWAEQGVLLLNTHLTVEHGKALSHQMIGWKRFTKIVLYELIKDQSPKVFMLWGSNAQSLYEEVVTTMLEKKIKIPSHLILKAKHPAADLYNADVLGNVVVDYPRTFSGCKHFSQANEYLKKNNRKQIKW